MKTKLINLTQTDPQRGIEQAAHIVENGGLVAFPTETVYGIACRAEQSSIARLDEVKGRAAEKRYTLHIGDPSQLSRFVPRVPLRAQKLIDNYWPGPLTIVFDIQQQHETQIKKAVGDQAFELLYRDGTLGVRCPNNPLAVDLLKTIVWPVVAPSANYAGESPATTAKQALDKLNGKIDAVLSDPAAECTHGKGSTVVKFTNGRLNLLREGTFSEAELNKASQLRICFVCTGNTCRSPMAELFCRKILSEKLASSIDELDKIGYKISSAGVGAWPDRAASEEVCRICQTYGIDASRHRSHLLTRDDAENSDIIFVMTQGHRQIILENFPEVEGKCLLLSTSGDIPDPIGGGEAVYKQCADRIMQALKKRIDEVLL